jgi:hypothetical protein
MLSSLIKVSLPHPALSALLCSIMLVGGASVAAAQSADQIVKQAQTAMGGEKAIRRVPSWQAKGTITRQSDGATGSYRAAAMRPDLYMLAVEIQGFEASEGFNGKSGWRHDSREGLRTLFGTEGADFQAEADYHNHRWFNHQKEKPRLAYAGQQIVNNKPAHAVELTTIRDVKIKIWFDAASGLLVKEELPAGNGRKIFEYSDFRAVNGVMEPFAIELSAGEEQFNITLEQIAHNQPLDRALFDFPKLSDETLPDPLPDMDALLKQLSDHQDALDKLLDQYTYTQVITARDFDKRGALKEKESETFRTIFHRGFRIRRLLAKNHQPLSDDEQAREDRRIEKQIQEIEKSEAANEGFEADDRDDQHITLGEVLRTSKITNPRRERYRQRDVIVFDFEPNQTYKAKRDFKKFLQRFTSAKRINAAGSTVSRFEPNPSYKPKKDDFNKIMQKFSGAVWVDAADLQVVRIEAWMASALKVGGGVLATLKPGGGFVLEQERFNNEIWLPSYAEFNFTARVLLLAGFRFNATVKYGDYKRFNVEAKKEELKDPAKAESPTKL